MTIFQILSSLMQKLIGNFYRSREIQNEVQIHEIFLLIGK